MKLYIESVFDKETNKFEDVKTKAIEAANKLEARHNNNAVGKIYYFSIPLDKVVVAIGNTGKQVLDIDNNIAMIKDMPDLDLGDVPTKMARYQELLIPRVDLKEKKVVFTKIRDMNGENEIGAEFNLTEVTSNNPVYDFQGYKVEVIDEQPKFLKIKAGDIIKGEVSFMVGSFNTIEKDDVLNIIINGKELVISLNRIGSIKIIKNETEFYVDTQLIKKIGEWNSYGRLKGQQAYKSNKGYYSSIAKIILKGYFTSETNISVLGKTDESFENEAYGYVWYI